MTTFSGTFEQLMIELSRAGIAGEWRICGAHHFQFRTDQGGVLNWWSTTGTVYFQGQFVAARRLERALLAVSTDASLEAAQPLQMSDKTLSLGLLNTSWSVHRGKTLGCKSQVIKYANPARED